MTEKTYVLTISLVIEGESEEAIDNKFGRLDYKFYDMETDETHSTDIMDIEILTEED